jgi:hypothetical protein
MIVSNMMTSSRSYKFAVPVFEVKISKHIIIADGWKRICYPS